MSSYNDHEFLGPQEIADDIIGSVESQRQALDVVTGFQAGMEFGLNSWEASHVEDSMRQHKIGTSLEYRKGWAIGQAMGAVKRTSEGKTRFKMS